ncbi:sensor histidine kinase [Streptomyces tsukubensis]|uniref:sensor histidine kinase n=1 Tax=Streptomyces tsukubensis TaxID=83656 RepID=UPI003F4F09CC
MTETNRSPEYRLAVGVLRGLREDLIHDAFAYRPLPPMRTDGPLLGGLPDPIRKCVQWIPHAFMLFVAAVIGGAGLVYQGLNADMFFENMLPTALIALAVIRPVGAFWLTLTAPTWTSLFTGYYDSYHWLPGAFVAHLLIMFVVAVRSRPRTAAWMWLLTTASSIGAEVIIGDYYFQNMSHMLVASAMVLTVGVAISVRRTADQEVRAERTVTAVERDKRTVLEERTTIARELHDVVAHHMSVVAIQAEAAPYRVENPPEELVKAFATIRENAVSALTELRRILGVVRAEDYEAPDAPQPVLADLDSLVANVRETGLDAEKIVTGAVRPLPQGVELSAYRIVQEALSNVLRHAPGATARVEVSYVLGGLGLRVVNTAPQGEVRPSPGAGHGITGMQERISMLGGELAAGATEDGGYEVTAFVPIASAEPEPEPGRTQLPERARATGNPGTGPAAGTERRTVILEKPTTAPTTSTEERPS